ncbi:MAG: hypothetical protein RQ752_01090 [Thermohalobaculum sp.]|nr:hypothetical protein [Thermohalobaculum sp.]
MTSTPEPAGRRRTQAEAAPILIPGDLMPADATALRSALLAGLDAPTCRIDLDDAPPSPSALQLLVATQRMAARDGLAAAFGSRAQETLARLGTRELIGE